MPAETLDGRVDLRELPTMTIDPDGAKDFDDALSFRREPDGIRAWVHIADVSWFVRAGIAARPGRRRARVLDLRPRPRRADAAAGARRRRLLAPAASGPALRHGRDAAARRAALLPLGDQLERAADLRRGGAARGGAGDPRAARPGRPRSRRRCERRASRAARSRSTRPRSSSRSPTAASSAPGARASRTRTCSSRS